MTNVVMKNVGTSKTFTKHNDLQAILSVQEAEGLIKIRQPTEG